MDSFHPPVLNTPFLIAIHRMRNLNTIQTLSIVGIIFSVIVQITLMIIGKKVHTIWALYPTWVFVFFIGWLMKKYNKYDDDHHHH